MRPLEDRPAELGKNLGHGRPRKSMFGGLLFWLYGRTLRPRIRNEILKTALRLEGGDFLSVTARRILAHYHGVEIGDYTHGSCFVPGAFDPGTKIGPYCSIAGTVRRMGRNHPMNLRSMHAFFFNESLVVNRKKIVEHKPIDIGHDVWLGHHAIILPGVNKIGDGAVIGAGAVVNRDIPPYAVVVGNPGRVVRFRFSEEVRKELQASGWWKKSFQELLPDFEEFQRPLDEGPRSPKR